MTLWPQNEPLAIIDWKVNHVLNHVAHRKNRREHTDDIQWLRETSDRVGGDLSATRYSWKELVTQGN